MPHLLSGQPDDKENDTTPVAVGPESYVPLYGSLTVMDAVHDAASST